MLIDLLRKPLWLAGILAVIVAGVGQAAALATGPLALVQPLFIRARRPRRPRPPTEHALQGGPLVASQPALTLGDATVSLALGVLLYEEHLRGHWWLVPEVLGVGLVVVGVFALARAESARE